MSNFDNAYQAASAIAELSNVELNNSISLAITNLTQVINNEINSVKFEQVRFDANLVKNLKALEDLAFYISAAAFSVSRDEGHLNSNQLHSQISALFRCAADMMDDLNDNERYDWDGSSHDGSSHWAVAANANRKLQVLREEQEEAA